MNKNTIKNQLGYTLIELSIGLVVVALVIAGILGGVQNITKTVAINETINASGKAIARLKTLTARDPDTSNFQTKAVAVDLGVFQGFKVDTTTKKAFTQLGTEVEAWAPKNQLTIGADWQYFKFRVWTLDPGMCADIASGLESLATEVAVYTNTYTDTYAYFDVNFDKSLYKMIKSYNTKYDSSKAATACNSVVSNGVTGLIPVEFLINRH